MEMEIPDLEELQWLEANSNLQEEEEEEEDYPVDEEEDEGAGVKDDDDEGVPVGNLHSESLPEAELQPCVSVEARPNNNKKRPRSHSLLTPHSDTDTDTETDTETRVRVKLQGNQVQDQDHDDWLRLPLYDSPTRNSIKYLSRYASEIDGDCMPITAASASSSAFGERVYAMLHKHAFTPHTGVASVNSLKTPSNSGGLLSQPITILLQKAEQDALLKASSEVQNSFPETPILTQELWVNKYAPKSFTELLSDENTNREVLIWLKQWDHAVFGTGIRNTDEEVLSALRRHSSITHHQKHSDTSSMRKNSGLWSAEKHGGHPTMLKQENFKSKGVQGLHNKRLKGSGSLDQKVLLLCGPPGLGKTTLAHVVAKHCGYHVVEINASDDRSSAIIEAKILDAVQMNSVMADSKPKCLVIDEIDGALGEGKGAVDIIVKMVAADRKNSAGKEISTTEGLSGSSSQKKERKAPCLSRPVICICNDLYAPALRPLRLIAKVHVFAQPTLSRVVSR